MQEKKELKQPKSEKVMETGRIHVKELAEQAANEQIREQERIDAGPQPPQNSNDSS
jgi:hypothetical protein